MADKQDILLAILKNQSENIEYTKKRTNLIVAFYSAITVFAVGHTEHKTLIVLALEAMAFCFSCIIFDNYDKIKNRRDALTVINQELELSDNLRDVLDRNRQDKGWIDKHLSHIAAAYMFFSPIIVVLLIS